MKKLFLMLAAVATIAEASAAEAKFYRGINLNGPALTIDGHAWEGKDAPKVEIKGNAFENPKVPLKPPTDAARTQMIRSSRWGGDVSAAFQDVPAGPYQVFVYVWEDNHNERFDVLVNGEVVEAGFHSGSAGMWKKLGPWPCESRDGKITVAARGGAANLSGIEVWAGTAAIPQAEPATLVVTPTAEQTAFFESKIRPLLVERCYECHSASAKKIKGGLVLDSRAGVLKGGDTGPGLTAGDPDASLIIQAVRYQDKDLAMPPKDKLPPEQIAVLEEWVRMGAPDPRTEDTVAVVKAKNEIDWAKAREWWSLRPLSQGQPPQVQDAAWPINDIDRFILARLEQAGLAPVADAEPRVFIRRATYDLIGLPPTPEEVEAFVAEVQRTGNNAYERLIDRLLASPHYGERWGRHWLDVVRYADTAGDNSDFPIPQMHRYRDWVIGALNRDMPYDRFVRAQLAGDLLPDRKPEDVIATGYIANSRRFGSRVDDYPQHLTIEDTLDNFGRAFLGLTINCARCHDHKFDPITTRDYYGLYGIFHSTRYPWPGIELEQRQRDLVPLVPAEKMANALKTLKEHQDARERLAKQVKDLEKELKEKKDDEKLKADLAKAKEALTEAWKKPLPFELAYGVAEAAKREDVKIQQKGDPAKPGEVVRRHFPTVLGGMELPAEERSSGRLQLADWLISGSNPLPARVMANRLWVHHFGRGIVPTPNDFGKQGKPPTHPELLDWLAQRFVNEGWSLKQMHRLIMLSRTYRLGSALSEQAAAKDPNNECLSAYPRRRLDAEAIRDTLLVLGGGLDIAPGGEHPFPPQREWKFTQHNPFKAVYESNKRSVYLMTQRLQRHPYLAIFDGADPSVSTPQRAASTTPLQALFLLNDPLVHEQSRRFAERIMKEEKDDSRRIDRAFQLAFSRPATPDEIESGRGFLTRTRESLEGSGTPGKGQDLEAWHALVRVLFRLNEFVYLD
jgi:hypothetical protein